MKKFWTLSFLSFMLLALCSCGNGNTKKLLKSVPENSGVVVAIDLEEILEQTGSKVSGDGVEYSSELKKCFDLIGEESLTNVLKKGIVKGSSVVLFEYKGAPYVTFFTCDEKKFKNYMEEVYTSASWEKDGDYAVLTRTSEYGDSRICAIKDEQVWILSEYESRESGSSRNLLGVIKDMDDDDSYAKTDGGKYLCDTKWFGKDAVVKGVVSLSSVSKAMGSEGALLRQAFNKAYENAEYLTFEIASLKGEAEAVCQVVDSDFDECKLNMEDLQVIDMNVVESLKGNCAVIFAGTFPGQTMKRAAGQLGMGEEVTALVGSIDGTFAFGVCPITQLDQVGASAVISFTSEAKARQCGELLQSEIPSPMPISFSTKGSKLIAFTDQATGKFSGPENLKDLEDCYMGIIFSDKLYSGMLSSLKFPLKSGALLLKKDGKGAKLVLKLTTGQDEPMIMSMLKFVTKFAEDPSAFETALGGIIPRGGIADEPAIDTSGYDNPYAYDDTYPSDTAVPAEIAAPAQDYY